MVALDSSFSSLIQEWEQCELELYLPNYFARQFGYNQLYVENPNIAFRGILVDGAQAWQ